MKKKFQGFAEKASKVLGSPWMFIVVLVVIAVWAASGPIIQSTDTWQLVMNTIANTFELVILVLIQNSENRGQDATQTKLDEIIRVLSDKGREGGGDEPPANTDVMQAEDKPEEEIESMKGDVRRASGEE